MAKLIFSRHRTIPLAIIYDEGDDEATANAFHSAGRHQRWIHFEEITWGSRLSFFIWVCSLLRSLFPLYYAVVEWNAWEDVQWIWLTNIAEERRLKIFNLNYYNLSKVKSRYTHYWHSACSRDSAQKSWLHLCECVFSLLMISAEYNIFFSLLKEWTTLHLASSCSLVNWRSAVPFPQRHKISD